MRQIRTPLLLSFFIAFSFMVNAQEQHLQWTSYRGYLASGVLDNANKKQMHRVT